MRHLLFRSLAALACFGVFSLAQTSAAPKPDQSDKPDFNGTWTLDLKASTSVEPLMKQIGANLFEQKYAAWITLKATVHQTEQVLTVATRRYCQMLCIEDRRILIWKLKFLVKQLVGFVLLRRQNERQ